MRIFINLTPLYPLSTLGEGEDIKKEGLTPLLNTPIKQGFKDKALRVGENSRH